MSATARGALAASLAAAIWGGMYVVSRLVLGVIPPLTLLVIRFLVALPALWIWHGLTERRAVGWRWPSRRAWLDLAVIGGVGYCLSLAAQFGGTALGGASAGAIITSATPAFVALFAWLLLRERPTLRQTLGLALAFGGVLLVVDAGRAPATDGARNPNALFGGALLVIAAVTWALYSVLVRRAGQAHGLSTLTITLGATVVGLMFDLPLAGIELTGMTIGPITPLIVLGVLYLGLVSTALAFHLWNLGFKLLDANTAALCFFAQPVVGATLGVLLLGEPLSFGLALGATLILGGALVSVARRLGG